MSGFRVLVLGGYGFFGRRLVERLSRQPGLEVQVAGRSLAAAHALVRELDGRAQARLDAVSLDARALSLPDELRQLAPHVLVNASGPFQGADYHVPESCIATGTHYVDLADARDYVTGIGVLHERAAAARVLVTSGASSVPALSSAAADHLSRDLVEVSAIDIGISPGNRTERGLSTVRAILSYCGQPVRTLDGADVFGWDGAWRHHYPAPIGPRLLSPCDVPDLALFPLRYAASPKVRFGAGLELGFLHRGMNIMSWMARAGLVREWSRHAGALKWIADRFRAWGSDAGAMHVTVRGRDAAGSEVRRTWHLVAAQGHGPHVPALAAAAMVSRLQRGSLRPGAFACMGLLGLADFEREMEGLSITTSISE